MTTSPRTDADPAAGSERRRQEVVAELGRRALETDDLGPLLSDAVGAVADALGTDWTTVLESPPGEDRLLPRAETGCEERVDDATPIPAGGDTLAGRAVDTGTAVVVEDRRTDDRFGDPDPRGREVASGIGVVVGPVDEPWGALETSARTSREFSDADVAFVRSVANVLAGAAERSRLETRVHEERTLKDQLLETSPVGITLIDADGMNVFANDRAEEILGRSLAELRSYAHDDERWNLVDEDGAPISGAEMPFAVVEETGEPVYDEVIGIDHPDGSRVWISAHCAPLSAENEDFAGAVYAFEDITERKRLENDLETTYERITDAVHGLDTDWTITYANDRARELIDPEGEGMVGSNVWERFPDAAARSFKPMYERAMETQEPVTFEEYSDEVGGWVEVNAYPSASGLSIYFRDVTERREREQQLERFERMVETVNDGIYVTDGEGRFVFVNDALVSMSEHSREELLGAHGSRFFGDRFVDTDEREWRDLIDGTVDAVAFETEITGPGGEPRTVHNQFVPLEMDDEMGRVGVTRDVTERKARERALLESETRFRMLVENFPNGSVGLFDESLTYEVAGGELLYDVGYTPEDVIGTTIYGRYPADLIEEIEPYFRTVFEGESNAFDFELEDRDLLAHTLPVRDATGEIYAGMVVVQDVSERRRYQRRLEESNRQLEQFAYAASHDLQEPLRMVSSYLTLVDRRYTDQLDEDGREFIAFAVDGADRMRGMIDGLLEYSRVETRGDPFEPTDLDAVLADTRRDLEVQIAERDAEITVESLPCVQGDPTQLRQLFQNLLSNAIAYAGDEPPTVEVSAERDGDRWVVAVRDEGIGIDPDDAERIFGVFQRLHAVGEGSGSGIGLALCQRIVDRHGGDIWVDSEPGEGSTFFVSLPAADSE